MIIIIYLCMLFCEIIEGNIGNTNYDKYYYIYYIIISIVRNTTRFEKKYVIRQIIYDIF